MVEPDPWGEFERVRWNPCVRCARPIPPSDTVCPACLETLAEEHRPAFERDVARLELHLRFEADYPCEGGG